MNARAGGTIPSPAILGRVGRAYVAAVDEFALDNELAVVHFKRHERNEDVAHSYVQAAEREDRFGVVLIGRRRRMRGVAGAMAATTRTRMSSSVARTISDQLDLRGPDNVQIVFDRKITKATPGVFQTK